jgi:hypothetical protein
MKTPNIAVSNRKASEINSLVNFENARGMVAIEEEPCGHVRSGHSTEKL